LSLCCEHRERAPIAVLKIGYSQVPLAIAIDIADDYIYGSITVVKSTFGAKRQIADGLVFRKTDTVVPPPLYA